MDRSLEPGNITPSAAREVEPTQHTILLSFSELRSSQMLRIALLVYVYGLLKFSFVFHRHCVGVSATVLGKSPRMYLGWTRRMT
jgi:hypothetical protein